MNSLQQGWSCLMMMLMMMMTTITNCSDEILAETKDRTCKTHPGKGDSYALPNQHAFRGFYVCSQRSIPSYVFFGEAWIPSIPSLRLPWETCAWCLTWCCVPQAILGSSRFIGNVHAKVSFKWQATLSHHCPFSNGRITMQLNVKIKGCWGTEIHGKNFWATQTFSGSVPEDGLGFLSRRFLWIWSTKFRTTSCWQNLRNHSSFRLSNWKKKKQKKTHVPQYILSGKQVSNKIHIPPGKFSWFGIWGAAGRRRTQFSSKIGIFWVGKPKRDAVGDSPGWICLFGY